MSDELATLPQPSAAAEENPPPPPLWWQLKQFCEAFDNGQTKHRQDGTTAWNVIMWHLMTEQEKDYVIENIKEHNNESLNVVYFELQNALNDAEYINKLASTIDTEPYYNHYPRLYIISRFLQSIKTKSLNYNSLNYFRENIFESYGNAYQEFINSECLTGKIWIKPVYIHDTGNADSGVKLFINTAILLNGLQIENSNIRISCNNTLILNIKTIGTNCLRYYRHQMAIILINSTINSLWQNNSIVADGIVAENCQLKDCFFDKNISLSINNCIFNDSLQISLFSILLNVNFTNCTFKQNADFSNVTFTGAACFDDVTFEGQAIFDGAVFHRYATFKTAKFKKSASFKGAKFLCHELAEDDKGQHIDTLSPSFISAEFSEVANFKGSRFDAPPHFEGAKVEVLLLEGSKFHNCTTKKDAEGKELLDEHGNPIPMTKGNDLAASAWSALMIITEKVHNLPQRQKFHHLLLEVEQQMIANSDSLKHERHHLLFYHIYDTLGKGSDIKPPILILISICLSYAMLSFGFLTSHLGISEWGEIALKSCKLMIYDAIPLLKFSKTEIDNIVKSISVITNGHWFLELSFLLFRGFVSVASPVCLFMIGLALRNRFRIKS